MSVLVPILWWTVVVAGFLASLALVVAVAAGLVADFLQDAEEGRL